VCSNCHPFYTGEQRIVDTEGQVDRFMKRLRAREDRIQAVETATVRRSAMDLPISELELGRERSRGPGDLCRAVVDAPHRAAMALLSIGLWS
jgi:hypothetical protein